MDNNIFVASSQYFEEAKEVCGRISKFDGEDYYTVVNYDAMPPFLMSIVSDSDHWMFISSNGSLTAGRKNSDHSLFPYATDDKIHESSELTGSKTIIHVLSKNKHMLWEPFSQKHHGLYETQKQLHKSLHGNAIIFEETNITLGLCFRIKWMSSEKFGWVKQVIVKNLLDEKRSVKMLDGFQNILPHGILKSTQETFSTLMDAYKKGEIHRQSNTGIFSLSSIPVDRPEPSEALSASTAWCSAKNNPLVYLNTEALQNFRSGKPNIPINNIRGTKCNYLVETSFELPRMESYSYIQVLETNQDSAAVSDLITSLLNGELSEEKVLKDVKNGSKNLVSKVKNADGIQKCKDPLITARHFSNVLFNIMRGGIYDNDYLIFASDIKKHIHSFNKQVFENEKEWIESIPKEIQYPDLLQMAELSKNKELYRLVLEYLPITFSRRHGDPSRPWNRFSIELKDEEGNRSLAYEGNWRDIFQNWEALSYSYPLFLTGIITKFLNASTIDGYNPYRITSTGIDWEIFEPENPWSFIGYWGDHQIIYLLKLLELQEKFDPSSLLQLLNKDIFVYANVPYRIKSYESIIQDASKTIDFDDEINKSLENLAATIGADGKLLRNEKQSLVNANLAEKMLLTLLTKLSNYIPGGGIWMNTQRPEWNDANNALVGNGISMVTLYYIRRYIKFLNGLFDQYNGDVLLNEDLHKFFEDINRIFLTKQPSSTGVISPAECREMVNLLGKSGEAYRNKAYEKLSETKKKVSPQDLHKFFNLASKHLDQTIEENKRKDGLYNAYNLISFTENSIEIENLQAMLEGQVAYLCSEKPDIDEIIQLLSDLKDSILFREDQQSYILYPDKEFDSFLNRNTLNIEDFSQVELLHKILRDNTQKILRQGQDGKIHFRSEFRNASILRETLSDDNNLSNIEITEILSVYEKQFKHRAFTGRSGSFYKYEGLGSIYWHMVSKLLLAVGDQILKFSKMNADEHKISQLKSHYQEIKYGIGLHKNPSEYGAIPSDPYSHTPSMMGAQQPGMTGQVKEDIISRWLELGIEVDAGRLCIHTLLISKDEFDENDQISFTFCGVPFKYLYCNKKGINIIYRDKVSEFSNYQIPIEESRQIFNRSQVIKEVQVYVSKSNN